MHTPTTPEEAAATFRCDRYACTLTGASCARTHVRAVQTHDLRREHCIRCEAGEERARLLNVGPVVCQVPGGDGFPCGGQPEQGAAYCRKHRAHRNMPPGPTGTADRFEPRAPMRAPPQAPRLPAKPRPAQAQPAKQREVFRPTGESPKHKMPAAKPAERQPKKQHVPKVGHLPASNCLECGWARSSCGTRGYPNLADWCGKCLKSARQAMAHRDIENTPENVEKWLRKPKAERPPLVSKRPPCARCGVVRGASRPGHPLTQAWCTFCLDVGRQALYRRGIKKAPPEQLAEAMRELAARKYTREQPAVDEALGEVVAAVARALAAGLSVEDVRAELRAAGVRVDVPPGAIEALAAKRAA